MIQPEAHIKGKGLEELGDKETKTNMERESKEGGNNKSKVGLRLLPPLVVHRKVGANTPQQPRCVLVWSHILVFRIFASYMSGP